MGGIRQGALFTRSFPRPQNGCRNALLGIEKHSEDVVISKEPSDPLEHLCSSRRSRHRGLTKIALFEKCNRMFALYYTHLPEDSSDLRILLIVCQRAVKKACIHLCLNILDVHGVL